MAFPRKLLNDGEELVLDLRPHWIYLAPSLSSLIVAVIVGIIVITQGWTNWVAVPVGVIVLVILMWFGVRYAKWATTNFVLTHDRVVSRRGVLAKSGMEIPLERINTVTFNQGIFERIVGAGDIGIESASQGGRETFSDIRRPAQVQREIYVQMEANNGRDYDRMAQATSNSMKREGLTGGVGAQLSVPEQLEKLDELRRNGVLTEAEFAAEKSRLLGS